MATPSVYWIHESSSSQVILPLLLLTDRKTNTAKEYGVQPPRQSRKPSADFYSNHLLQISKGSLTPLKAAGVHAMVQRRGKGRAGVERRLARLRMLAGVVELFK